MPKAVRPFTVRVIGQDYDVRYVNTDASMQPTYVGRAFNPESEFVVEAGRREHEHLLHEIIHSIECQMSFELPEEDVCRLTTGLLAVFRDTPGLVKYIWR